VGGGVTNTGQDLCIILCSGREKILEVEIFLKNFFAMYRVIKFEAKKKGGRIRREKWGFYSSCVAPSKNIH
jgi:hypothetical protein